jgi:hypothetical protein
MQGKVLLQCQCSNVNWGHIFFRCCYVVWLWVAQDPVGLSVMHQQALRELNLLGDMDASVSTHPAKWVLLCPFWYYGICPRVLPGGTDVRLPLQGVLWKPQRVQHSEVAFSLSSLLGSSIFPRIYLSHFCLYTTVYFYWEPISHVT